MSEDVKFVRSVRANVNRWRYVERDGNPTESGKYETAWVYGDTNKCGLAVIEFWPRSGWSLFARKYRVYAWRPLPELPPLLPEPADSE